MTYKLKIDPGHPLFSPYYFNFSRWGHHEKGRCRATRERPMIMKKLLRIVRRTKGKISSVSSVFINGQWMKIIIVNERG
jgi:hypothetical protein